MWVTGTPAIVTPQRPPPQRPPAPPKPAAAPPNAAAKMHGNCTGEDFGVAGRVRPASCPSLQHRRTSSPEPRSRLRRRSSGNERTKTPSKQVESMRNIPPHLFQRELGALALHVVFVHNVELLAAEAPEELLLRHQLKPPVTASTL